LSLTAWPWDWINISFGGKGYDIGQYPGTMNNEYSYFWMTLRADQMGNVGAPYAYTKALGPIFGPFFAAGGSFWGELATNKEIWKGTKKGFTDLGSSWYWNAVGIWHGFIDIFVDSTRWLPDCADQ